MSSETRTIRPYHGLDQFQGALDGCVLQVGQRKIEGGSKVSLTLDEYTNELCRLVLAEDDHDLHEVRGQVADGLGDLALTTSDVELVVLASAPRLKMVDVVFAHRLDELPDIPAVISFPSERPRALQAPIGGCDLRVYFCLARQFPPQPLHPWRKGTWLGKQDYALRSDIGGVGFLPVRLTDELRDELKLDPNTMLFANLEDQSTFDSEVPPDAVRVYVDEGLLDRLAVIAQTPIGKQTQRQLFTEAAWAIVVKAVAEADSETARRHADVDEFAGSLVHGLVEMVAGRGTDHAANQARNEQYRLLIQESNRFMANLEARLASRRDVLEIFED